MPNNRARARRRPPQQDAHSANTNQRSRTRTRSSSLSELEDSEAETVRLDEDALPRREVVHRGSSSHESHTAAPSVPSPASGRKRKREGRIGNGSVSPNPAKLETVREQSEDGVGSQDAAQEDSQSALKTDLSDEELHYSKAESMQSGDEDNKIGLHQPIDAIPADNRQDEDPDQLMNDIDQEAVERGRKVYEDRLELQKQMEEDGGVDGEEEEEEDDDEDEERDDSREEKERDLEDQENDREEQGEEHEAEAEEEEGDAEDPEEAERLQHRKDAMAALTSIELKFASLRDILYDDKIGELQKDVEMIENGTHPELASMTADLQKKRILRLKCADSLLMYHLDNIDGQFRAAHYDTMSRFLQQVRECREEMLFDTSQKWYQMQRERRQLDLPVKEMGYVFPERVSVQVRQRAAHNNEVSLLAGIAKYIGFPAAPSVEGATVDEMHQDLEVLGLASAQTVEMPSSSVFPNLVPEDNDTHVNAPFPNSPLPLPTPSEGPLLPSLHNASRLKPNHVGDNNIERLPLSPHRLKMESVDDLLKPTFPNNVKNPSTSSLWA